jgi:hypothetical protein
MAVHMVTRVGGEDYRVTLSRDDAGNYVAEAARLPKGEGATGSYAPHLRVVDTVKERALTSLFDSLQRVAARDDRSSEGPDLPAA